MMINDEIWDLWNRLLDPEFEPVSGRDRTLRDVLRFHNLVRNGGLFHAVETNRDQAQRAKQGFRELGLSELAALIDRGQTASSATEAEAELDQLEVQLNDDYANVLPNDEDLAEAFGEYVRRYPGEFERR